MHQKAISIQLVILGGLCSGIKTSSHQGHVHLHAWQTLLYRFFFSNPFCRYRFITGRNLGCMWRLYTLNQWQKRSFQDFFMRRKAQCKTNVNSIFIFSPILLFFSLLIKDYERIVTIIKRFINIDSGILWNQNYHNLWLLLFTYRTPGCFYAQFWLCWLGFPFSAFFNYQLR